MKRLSQPASASESGAAHSVPQRSKRSKRSKRSVEKGPPGALTAEAGNLALFTGRKVRSDCVLKNLPRARQEEIMAWCEGGRDGDGSGRGGVPYAQERLATEGMTVAITSLRRFCAWFRLRELLEQARDSEDLLDLHPAEIARTRACSQKLLLDLALAERDAACSPSPPPPWTASAASICSKPATPGVSATANSNGGKPSPCARSLTS